MKKTLTLERLFIIRKRTENKSIAVSRIKKIRLNCILMDFIEGKW